MGKEDSMFINCVQLVDKGKEDIGDGKDQSTAAGQLNVHPHSTFQTGSSRSRSVPYHHFTFSLLLHFL
jgi:hypothetical protein